MQRFRLNFPEAVEVCLKNVTAQSVVHKLAFALDIDEPGVFQLLHVVGERGGSDRKTVFDIATSAQVLVSAELLKYLVAARIGQRLGDEGDLAVRESSALCRNHLTTTVIEMPEPLSSVSSMKKGAPFSDAPFD